ncbi:hypothetical protein TNCV_1592701 [Trichonephila clavipes]|nr:hypothetical protein TNCV_1592701 [Trichonephila clavipes]
MSLATEDKSCPVEGIGTLRFRVKYKGSFHEITLSDVLFNPKLRRNLLSGSRLESKGAHFVGTKGRKPSVLHLKPFGCLAYAGVPKQIRKKFDMRAKMGIMMGYAQCTKGYRIWLIDENKLVETINVRFDENKRGINFRQKVNSNLGYNLNLPDYYDDEDDFDRVKDSLTSRSVSKTSTEMPSTSEKLSVSSDNHNLIPCTEVKWIRNIGRKVTGSNKDNTESQGFSDLSEQQEALMVEVTIPNCYKQAIRSRDASKWHDAMDKEINKAGWSNRRIGRHLGRSDMVVARCWQQWITEGRVYRRRGSGRPRNTNDREDRAIRRVATSAPTTSLASIQRHLPPSRHPVPSRETIRRRLTEGGLRSRRPLRRLPLTPHHRQCRLDFCRPRAPWSVTDWRRVIFSDESRFSLSADDHRTRVWRRTGQRSDPAFIVERHTAISQGVTVWGAISWDTRSSLVVLQGTLTARRYVDDILTPIVLPMLSSRPGPFINRIMLVHILRDSPNNVFKDMTSYHGLPGHQIFRQ